MKRIWRLLCSCRWYFVILGAELVWVAAFWLLKDNRGLMNRLADYVTTPYKQAAAWVCDLAPFSVSEALIGLLVIGGIWFIGKLIRDAVRRKGERISLVLHRLLGVGCAVLTAYTGFVYLWGVNYYTDTFQDRSGVYAQPPTTDQLYETARWFAQRLNESGAEVRRDGQGRYAEDMAQVIADSAGLYDTVTEEFPFLEGMEVQPKPLLFSELLSWLNTTGFFCPWLGESNFNNHSPACDRPATIAHELAHQRGIASEQEANFVAVLASTRSSSAAYRYSGYLLGYTYLNNALIGADPQRWQEVYATLSPEVLADMEDIRQYWNAHKNAVTDVADGITDRRLKSYGQELGRKSYGAVVDLLVVYYGDGSAQ